MRTSVLHTRAICVSCWTKEQNDQGICSQCHQQKMIFNKTLRCCHHCYQNLHAEPELRQYIERFTTAHPYYQRLFDLLISTLPHERITVKHTQQVRAFGHFLQTTKIPPPLSWEFIEETTCPASLQTDAQKCVRTSLLTLGHLLASRGEMETREAFLARRAALRPLGTLREQSPQLARLLEDYVTWLWQRKTAPKTVGNHLTVLIAFWLWCEERACHHPSAVHSGLVNDYLLRLTFQFRCTSCQATAAFDPGTRSAPGHCPTCKSIGMMKKEQRYTPHYVSLSRGMLFLFFTWAQLERMIIANPITSGRPHFQERIRHYPFEVVKQLCAYIVSQQADPMEALLLYLILFEGLSLQELCHAQLPTLYALRPDIPIPTLAEAYAILLPHPKGSRGRHAPGRPTIKLDFPEKAETFLKPLLMRFEQQRAELIKNPKNRYVFISAGVAGTHRHPAPVSGDFLFRKIRALTDRLVGFPCNPRTLRQTTGLLYADRAGGSILQMMGWKGQQAYKYLSAPRELIDPTHGEPADAEVLFPQPRKELKGREDGESR